MGDGYIQTLRDGERLVIIFTVTGPVDAKQVEEWTRKITEMRTQGMKIHGVTVRAEPLRGGGSPR